MSTTTPSPSLTRRTRRPMAGLSHRSCGGGCSRRMRYEHLRRNRDLAAQAFGSELEIDRAAHPSNRRPDEGGAVTAPGRSRNEGAPASVQESRTMASVSPLSIAQTSETVPWGPDRAPYFTAFVASSCRDSAKVTAVCGVTLI